MRSAISLPMAIVVLGVSSLLYSNPIPIPTLLMPEEYIDILVSEGPAGLTAAVDGEYPFQNVGHAAVAMLYPVAPASTDIGVWMDGVPVAWEWSEQVYPTILPEWPELPMIEWGISPVPDEFTVAAHYEHSLIERPEEWVFLYPMGTGKYLDTYAKETVAHVSVSLPERYLPKGVFRDEDPAAYWLLPETGDASWLLRAEVKSRPFEPLLEDFILTLIDRWADPLAWLSQPPDMADGRDIYSSVEVNCVPPADDFEIPPIGVSPLNLGRVCWWGSYPGWQDREPHPDLSAPPRPDYFLIRVLGEADGPGELLYEEQVDEFRQTYFGVVVRGTIDDLGQPVLEYEHKFEYHADLARRFIPLPGERYWLNVVAGPVACEWAWGWATSAVHEGEPAWTVPCEQPTGPAPQPPASLTGASPLDAPLIHCVGSESGGNGPRRYAYEVDSASYPMMEFRVGTSDLAVSRYSNLLIPEGWQFEIQEEPMGHFHGVKTPHGEISEGPCRCLTLGAVRWWTDDPIYAIELFTFGFDHPWASEDVSWQLTTRREGLPPETYIFHESWDGPVGTGVGPVHGPASDQRVDMAFALSSFYPPRPVRYRLIEGSTLTDDSGLPVPPIVVPIRGSFWLQLTEADPLFDHYAVTHLSFASPALQPGYTGRGEGTYRRGGEVALLEQMMLTASVNEVRSVDLDSGPVSPQAPFPWIEIDLVQVDPDQDESPFRRFSLHLVAVPWPVAWFSTEYGFHYDDPPSPEIQYASDGDLLSSAGATVRTNTELTSRLGIMPVVPDLGLDAVTLPSTASPSHPWAAAPEIWFSLEDEVFSETLGPLGHGDLLSDRGQIVRRNADLIAPFSPRPGLYDYGLDAVYREPDGRLLFSVEESFSSESMGVTINHGDLLAEGGEIVKTNAELMSAFQPIDPIPLDFGLDAIQVLSGGEIWFSTEVSFSDLRLGLIREGDVLSDTGRVVWRNLELLEPFGPLEDLADFGLDGFQTIWPATSMAWRSMRVHGADVGPLPIELEASVAAHSAAAPTVEPRIGGIRTIEVDFDAVVTVTGTIQARDLTHGTTMAADAQTVTDNGDGTSTLTIEFVDGLPDMACYEIELVDHVPGLAGHTNCQIMALEGDVDGNGSVQLADAIIAYDHNGEGAAEQGNSRCDVDVNGDIQLADAILAYDRNGNQANFP